MQAANDPTRPRSRPVDALVAATLLASTVALSIDGRRMFGITSNCSSSQSSHVSADSQLETGIASRKVSANHNDAILAPWCISLLL